MAGPGDEMAAAEGRGHGDLRASHADREQAVELLKVAFVQSRLDKDELDARVGQALTARTYTELAAVTADLPAAPTAAKLPQPGGAKSEAQVLRPGAVLAAATAIYAGAWLLAFFLPRTSEGDPMAGANLVVLTTFAYSIALVFAVGRILTDWQDKRSGSQQPRGPAPGPGGQASRCPPAVGPGGQLPPAGHGQQHTAEAARSDPAHPRSPGSRSAPRVKPRGYGVALALVRDGREQRAHPARPGAPRSADRAGGPLHLALVFGLSRTTARKYARIACGLLDGQPAEGAEA